MWAGMNGISLKKRGIHFIHININSLLPKIDEVHYIAIITNASVIGISETELDETILSSELEVNGYELVRLNRSRRGGGVASYIKSSIVYCYKDSFCSNTNIIFDDISLPKSKPIQLGILYWPSDKSDFVKHNNVFTETGVLDKQECYLLGDLNINLILDEKEIFSNKRFRSNSQNLSPLTKGYLDFSFSFSLEQLISIPTRVTSKTATLIDHALTDSTQKVSQCSVIELGISDHDLVYCAWKTPSLKSNERNDISVRSMKNYTKEKI